MALARPVFASPAVDGAVPWLELSNVSSRVTLAHGAGVRVCVGGAGEQESEQDEDESREGEGGEGLPCCELSHGGGVYAPAGGLGLGQADRVALSGVPLSARLSNHRETDETQRIRPMQCAVCYRCRTQRGHRRSTGGPIFPQVGSCRLLDVTPTVVAVGRYPIPFPACAVYTVHCGAHDLRPVEPPSAVCKDSAGMVAGCPVDGRGSPTCARVVRLRLNSPPARTVSFAPLPMPCPEPLLGARAPGH